MIGKFYLTLILLLPALLHGEEACGRTAIINNQPVLVDISSSSKGEGLRPYLNKDIVAKKYLDEYQERTLSPGRFALIGSLAIGLVLGGVAIPPQSQIGPFKAKDLITTGVSIMAINFLVAQGVEFKNENLLRKSIDEYNKRNRPRIYFLPYSDRLRSTWRRGRGDFGLMAGLQTSF